MGRFKFYRQLERADCGLACIRMLTRHHGLSVPLKHLKEHTDLSRVGMTVRDIMSVLGNLSMESVAVKVTTSKCLEMPLPAILHWRQNHFVVLYKVNFSKRLFYIADPDKGKICYSEKDFSSYWVGSGDDPRGIAIISEPLDDFKLQKFEKENVVKDFLSYITQFLKVHRHSFIFSLLATLLIMGADFAVPVLLKRTIDEGIGAKDLGLVWMFLLCQLCIAAGGLVASGIIELIMTKTGLRIHLEMVRKFLDRLARLPLSFLDRKVSSDFVQKIHDHEQIKSFLLDFPSSVFLISLSIIVFSVLLFHFSPLIFCFFILMSALELSWNLVFMKKRKSLNYAFFNLQSINSNHAYELTNGLADLKVNNAEQSRITKWNETQDKMNDLSVKSSRLGKMHGTGYSLLSQIKNLSITGIAAGFVISGDMSLGMLMTLGYITGRLNQPFQSVSNSFTSLQGALIAFQRIEDVIGEEPEWRGRKTFTEGQIEFKDVSFKYAGTFSPYILKNINLIIEKGKTIALVGESGCGKSTLIKLILGFYIPQKGQLSLGSHDVKDMDNSDWLSHCGVVMQEAKIFSGSILENIALSDITPDLNKVRNTLNVVGLSGFVDSLPMGVHTQLGVSGVEISGGQKQRLMIARALYKDPEILILDEATSSLDANNERRIVDNLFNFGRDRTVVIAAHRLSTIQNADKIVFMKEGCIAEIGSHDELLALHGDYWHLVRNQLSLERDCRPRNIL